MRWPLLAFAAAASFGAQVHAFAQEGVDCDAFVEGLSGFVRMVTPPRLCDRVAFAGTGPRRFTARNQMSRPVLFPDGRLAGFVDLVGPVASLHLVVWTGWLSPPDALFLATAARSQNWTYVPAVESAAGSVEVLVDGQVLRAASGQTAGDWAHSPWSSMIIGAQITDLPTFGVAVVSILLSKLGRETLATELASGSGLQALLQWRVLHDVDSPAGRRTLTTTGNVTCLRREDRVLSKEDLLRMPPVLKLLPLDWRNLETLAACE